MLNMLCNMYSSNPFHDDVYNRPVKVVNRYLLEPRVPPHRQVWLGGALDMSIEIITTHVSVNNVNQKCLLLPDTVSARVKYINMHVYCIFIHMMLQLVLLIPGYPGTRVLRVLPDLQNFGYPLWFVYSLLELGFVCKYIFFLKHDKFRYLFFSLHR
jgi:hypothetical protein